MIDFRILKTELCQILIKRIDFKNEQKEYI